VVKIALKFHAVFNAGSLTSKNLFGALQNVHVPE